MATTNVRVVGSGYSALSYNGKPIAFLEGVSDSGQRAYSDIGQGYQFIHPLNNADGTTAVHPVEIATSRVLAGGTLTFTIRELWNAPVWNQLAGLAGTNNIVDIFEVLARNPSVVTASLIIKPPNGSGSPRGKIYHNVTVVDIADGDEITIGSMAVTKGVIAAYTHSTNLSGKNLF